MSTESDAYRHRDTLCLAYDAAKRKAMNAGKKYYFKGDPANPSTKDHNALLKANESLNSALQDFMAYCKQYNAEFDAFATM